MPFLAPVVAAVSSFAASSALAGFAVQMGASLLLSAAARALAPKPNMSGGVQARTVTVREPISPYKLVYGETRKGGVIIFMHKSGSKGQILDLVVVLASNQVEAIGAIYFNGEEAVPAGSTTGSGKYADLVTVERALGSPTQSAFPGLRADHPTLWTAEHRMRGHAGIRLRLRFDAEAFPSGLPNITADITGKNDILDPRTGLRGYTNNAALCIADYASLAPFGIGAVIGAPDGIDEDSVIAAANVCDEEVAKPEGGVEPRYACNGVLSLADVPKANIEALLTAMAGRFVWSAGIWDLQAGAYQIPTETLTVADVQERGFSMSTRVSMSANFNAVRGTFVSPENDWQPDDFPAYESDVYLAEDNGERRYADIALPFTTSAAMAQRLAKIELEQQRRQLSVKMGGKLRAWRVKTGDTVLLDYARWGQAQKPYYVRNMRLDLSQGDGGPLLLPELTLQETSPLVYDADATEFEIYAAAPRTSLPSAFDIEPPTAPVAVEELYSTRGGGGIKTRAILTTQTDDPFVDSFQFSHRLSTVPEAQAVVGALTQSPSTVIEDLTPGTYIFGVRSRTRLGTTSAWVYGAPAAILGVNAAPTALTGFSVQALGAIALAKWDRHPSLDVQQGGEIEFRHSADTSANWTTSTTIARSVQGLMTEAPLPLKAGVYLSRAKDSQGIVSPVSRFVVTRTGLDGLTLLVEREEAPAFAGLLTDVTVVNNEAFLDDGVATGTIGFAQVIDLGTVRQVRALSDVRARVASPDNAFGKVGVPFGTTDPFGDTGGAEGDVQVWVRATDADPVTAGIADWGPWQRLDVADFTARGFQAEARLSADKDDFLVAVTGLKISIYG